MKVIGKASLTQRWTVRRFRPQQEWRRGKGSVSPSTCDIYDLRENPEAIAHKCGRVPLGAVAKPAVCVGRAVADVSLGFNLSVAVAVSLAITDLLVQRPSCGNQTHQLASIEYPFFEARCCYAC